MNVQYSESSINFFEVHKRFCEMACTQYDTNHITWAKTCGNQFLGDKREINGIQIYKAIDKSEAMTSQTDIQIGNYFG